MKAILSTAALCTVLAMAAGASAQVPSGGPGSDAKANAALKPSHTVNDGGARRGRNSFTEGQARQHILKAGYASVTGLAKGDDGVWRGTAMKNGASVPVGMDYKGNVSEGAAPMAAMSRTDRTTTTTTTAEPPPPPMAASTSTTTTHAMSHHRRHHRRHHGVMNRCADPGPNGAACSGVDRNKNGVSDREDRAIRAGARP